MPHLLDDTSLGHTPASLPSRTSWVPGFRTRRWWKKLLAVVGYIVFAVLLLVNAGSTPLLRDKVVNIVTVLLMTVPSFAFLTDLGGVRARLFPASRWSLAKRSGVFLLLFVVCGVAVAILDTQHTATYRTQRANDMRASEEARVEQDRLRQQEQDAKAQARAEAKAAQARERAEMQDEKARDREVQQAEKAAQARERAEMQAEKASVQASERAQAEKSRAQAERDAAAQQAAEEKAKANAEAKAKAQRDARAAAERSTRAQARQANEQAEAERVYRDAVRQIRRARWNSTDVEITTNGNFAVAGEVLRLSKFHGVELPESPATPQQVMRAPWRFYGEYVTVDGVLLDIKAHPSGSKQSRYLGGGEVTAVEMLCDDGTHVLCYALGVLDYAEVGGRFQLMGLPLGRFQGTRITSLVLAASFL